MKQLRFPLQGVNDDLNFEETGLPTFMGRGLFLAATFKGRALRAGISYEALLDLCNLKIDGIALELLRLSDPIILAAKCAILRKLKRVGIDGSNGIFVTREDLAF